MALAEPWHLRSRARECAATQAPFVNGQQIITAIFPDPASSGYLRKDFSVDGWKNRPVDGEIPFSFWKTTYVVNSSGEKPAIEKEDPEDILRRLVEEDEDHTENTRYILAIMLERKKIIRETDSQRTPNGIIRVYEHRKTGEVLIVKDPDIPLDRIEAVQQEVFDLLENNGRTPEPEFPEETSAPAETVTEPAAEEKPAEETDEPQPPADDQRIEPAI